MMPLPRILDAACSPSCSSRGGDGGGRGPVPQAPEVAERALLEAILDRSKLLGALRLGFELLFADGDGLPRLRQRRGRELGAPLRRGELGARRLLQRTVRGQ